MCFWISDNMRGWYHINKVLLYGLKVDVDVDIDVDIDVDVDISIVRNNARQK